MTDKASDITADESEIRRIFDQWSQAVRNKDLETIRAHHHPDLLMFDVPPPFLSRGIAAYMETWKMFHSMAPMPVKFDFDQLEIHASPDVAFLTAIGHCRDTEPGGQIAPLDFRLTMGLRKIGQQWLIVHEHHSVPATS
jgi:ketosteroid isomerase-like protein